MINPVKLIFHDKFTQNKRSPTKHVLYKEYWAWKNANLRHTDGLYDLEDRRSAHHEDEQRQDHGPHGRAVALLFL